jgi:hypothetical protein
MGKAVIITIAVIVAGLIGFCDLCNSTITAAAPQILKWTVAAGRM